MKGKRGDGLTLGPRQLQTLAAHGRESLATTAIVVGSMYILDISGGVHDEMAKSARGHRQGRQKIIAAIAAIAQVCPVSWRKLVDIAYCVTARQGPRALSLHWGTRSGWKAILRKTRSRVRREKKVEELK